MSRALATWPILFVLLPTPARAADPARYAGLEVGGSGVKLTVLEVQGDGTYRRLHGASQRTNLSVLTTRKEFAKKEIDATARHLADYRELARDKYKVPDDRIILVGSSGVPDAKNRADLVNALKTAVGKTIRFIDEKTEVELTLLGVVPKAQRDQAITLDIGSGNTKGGYHLPGKPLVYTAVPLGTVTFTQKAQQAAKKKETSFAEAAAALRATDLVAPLKKGAAAMPELKDRNRVYLSGGLVWALVSHLKPEMIDKPYVTFTAADVEAFAALLKKAGGKHPVITFDSITDQKQRDKAVKELATVQKVFTAENLVAGAEILKALVEAFGLKGKTVIFPRNATYGWLAAYVAGEAKAGK